MDRIRFVGCRWRMEPSVNGPGMPFLPRPKKTGAVVVVVIGDIALDGFIAEHGRTKAEGCN